MQTRYGGFALSIKIGLSFGGLQIDIIESDTGQARLLASGDALTWAGQAEHSAERGQIAYHASIDTIGGAAALISSPRRPQAAQPNPAIDRALQRCVPTALAERVP